MKKCYVLINALVMVIMNLYLSPAWSFSGGDGTPNNPYQIATANDLIELGDNTSLYDKNFILTADIDLSGYVFDKAVIARCWYDACDDSDSVSWIETSYDNEFTGTFDGNEKIISNLTIEHPDSPYTPNYEIYYMTGLFGSIGQTGKVFNLGLKNVDVAGYIRVGGMCSENRGSIYGCYTTGFVNMKDTYSGNYFSYFTMTTGGLCGINSGSVENCYSTVNVIGKNPGSLIGYGDGAYCCYSTGTARLKEYSIADENSFKLWGSSGYIDTTNMTTAQQSDIETYISAGWDFSTDDGDSADWKIFPNDYPILAWENITTVSIPDITGLPLEQAQTQLTDLGLTYSIINGYNEMTSGLVCEQYPVIGQQQRLGGRVVITVSLGQCFSGGDGTDDNPYQIATVDELLFLANTLDFVQSDPNDNCFILTSDIDMSNSGIFPAALISGDNNSDSVFSGKAFVGIFNGNGHVISNLSISGENYCGLFGKIGSGSIVKNLGLTNLNIIGENNVGGLCGENDGSISNCYVTGNVKGENHVGGLVGFQDDNSSIQNCYSTAAITGNYRVGGLCGHNNNYSRVTNCYFAGLVAGGNEVGCLLGVNYGILTNCFWDTQVSGNTSGVGSGSSTGSIGLTTFQMYDVAKYTSAGWDFSANDGDAADWKILRNDYPALSWENHVFVTVPDLSGLTLEQAQVRLIDSGLIIVPSTISYDYNDSIAEDLVCSQFPLAGQQHRLGGSVSFDISLGRRFSGGDGTEDNPYQIASVNQLLAISNTINLMIDKDYPIPESNYHYELIADIDFSGFGTLPLAAIAGDIDPTSLSFSGKAFVGYFNGNDHAISNLSVSGSDNCGLFGKIGSGGKIENLRLLNVNITATEWRAGGLCGENDGLINNCYTTGFVTAACFPGGLCGDNSEGSIVGSFSSVVVHADGIYSTNYGNLIGAGLAGGLCGTNSGSITDCYATGEVSNNAAVTASSAVGGLCGSNSSSGIITGCYASGEVMGSVNIGGLSGFCDGKIYNSYATGAVYGTGRVGGLVGSLLSMNSPGTIVNCYSTGLVTGLYPGGGLCGFIDYGSISRSFWDVETSGIGSAGDSNFGAIGKTTAQMQDIATYVDAGWDFSDDDGDAADWQMVRPGEDYPRLAWQELVTGDIAGSWGVDMTDLEMLAAYWLADDAGFDIDGIEGINMLDFGKMAENWMGEKTSANFELPSRLISHWTLDETEGSVAIDSSDYTNSGTVYGNPTRETGIIDGCYNFNGQTDYIIALRIHGISRANPRTISAYIKADEDLANNETNLHCIVSWGQMSVSKKWIFGLDDTTGKLCLAIYGARLVGGSDLEDGQWHHVAIVLPDGANNINQVKMFVDGTEIETNAADLDLTLNTTATEVVIGGYDNTSYPFSREITGHFAGSIDDVRVYNTDLSSDEIMELGNLQ